MASFLEQLQMPALLFGPGKHARSTNSTPQLSSERSQDPVFEPFQNRLQKIDAKLQFSTKSERLMVWTTYNVPKPNKIQATVNRATVIRPPHLRSLGIGRVGWLVINGENHHWKPRYKKRTENSVCKSDNAARNPNTPNENAIRTSSKGVDGTMQPRHGPKTKQLELLVGVLDLKFSKNNSDHSDHINPSCITNQ